MKIAWTTDQHVGNYGKNGGPVVAGLNQRCRDVLRSFAWARARMVELGCSTHVGLGDLFDYDRVEPQVIAAMQDLLDSDTIVDHFLVGNHDQRSLASLDHALAPLRGVAKTIADTEPRWVTAGPAAILLVPFRSGRAEDWLPEVVAAASKGLPQWDGPHVLAFHLGVSDSRTPYYLDDADDEVCLGTVERVLREHRFDYAFAGNWHVHRRWTVEGAGGRECEVVQVGTLAPNRFTDTGGRFGTMAVLDTDTRAVEIIDVPGPRFVKVAGIVALRELVSGDRDPLAIPLYVSVSVPPEDVAEAEDLLTRVEARATEIQLDDSRQKAQAAAAVQVAVSAQSHHEAVVDYIRSAPIDAPRAAVERFVLDCLQEAK